MNKKICTICKLEKDFSNFHKGVDKNGLSYRCKDCCREYAKKNVKKENERKNKWKLENYDKVLLSKKKYYQKNKEKESVRNNIYTRNKRKNNPIFKLSCNLRSRIVTFLKTKNITKRNTTYNIIGIDSEELRIYIEKQFKEGMCWENYGEWHIDHIIPLSSAQNEEDAYRLCHYTNLQPLWAIENLQKTNKIITNN
jgi:hypothetical protein